jgi:acetyl-CoA carboxylase alpha subunit
MAYKGVNYADGIEEAPTFKHLSKKPISYNTPGQELNPEFYQLRKKNFDDLREAKLIKHGKEDKDKFLKKLIKKSFDNELETSVLRHYYTRKLINKPFARLQEKERIVFILHLAGFTQRQIRRNLVTGMNVVNKAIKRGYEEYPP